MFDLVVFDCDGVLVDSEILVVEVEAEMLTEAGFPITAHEITERFVGLSYATMMAALAADAGREVPESLNRRIQEAAMARLARDVRPVSGMDGLLADLVAPRCVASSSDLDRITLSLRVSGLDAHFVPERIFSAQMVERPKPAPDLFQLAAGQLGVDPDRCVVVEDSPHGVAGAVAAGMTAVGLVAGGHARPDLGDRLEAAGAATVFASSGELASYLLQHTA